MEYSVVICLVNGRESEPYQMSKKVLCLYRRYTYGIICGIEMLLLEIIILLPFDLLMDVETISNQVQSF